MKRVARCIRCGEEYKPSHNEQKFCGYECYWEWLKTRPSKKRILKDKVCLTCGREFRPYKGTQKYCSQKCYHSDPKIRKIRSEFMGGENAPQKSKIVKDKIRKTVTGIWRERYDTYGMTGKHHTEGSKRKMGENRDYPSGPEHPRWKGGYSKPYYGKNWERQRQKALKRDLYTCQICGKTNGEIMLVVHHIIPFKNFDSYLEANKLENLITYCMPCHNRVTSTGEEALCIIS